MKTSWIIGLIMFYIIILFGEIMATNGQNFDPNTTLGGLNEVALYNGSNALTNLWTIATNLGAYFTVFCQAMMLWSPTLFAGNYIYFWFIICLPIDIGIVASVVSIFRGVHAS